MNSTINNLSRQLGEQLQKRHWHVTCAESCTGGGVAHAVTEVAGSSGWFELGFVTYSNAAKRQLVGVADETLLTFGAVSEAVVTEMATGALAAANADLAVAVSGIAGPDGGTEDKPVGTVWFAWVTRGGQVVTQRLLLSGDRQAVRQQAIIVALEGLIQVSK